MHRRSPRVLLFWSAAIAVALVTAIVVSTDLATLHRRAGSLGPERAVAVAVRDLPIGTTVGASDLEVRRVHASQLPPGALTAADIEGRVVVVTVLEDGFLTTRNLAPADRTGLDGVVPAGMRIVRVTADGAPPLHAGDAIDVLATFDPAIASELPEGWDPTVLVARGALVVDGSDGADADDATTATGAAVGVSVIVTEEEARGLAFAAANGVVTLAVAPPEEARPFGVDAGAST
jgi:Flp pilus assembly protein CpaB